MKTTREQIEKMDLTSISKLVENHLGVNPVFGNIKVIEEGDGGLYFEFSNTINVDAGVFGKICREFQVVGYGRESIEGLWAKISFRYTYKAGGYNGTDIGTASYIAEKNEWVYQSVEG